MAKDIDYCSLEPIFPERAFMLFLLVLHKDQLLGIVPVDSIYTTPDNASLGVEDTVKQFETMDQEITIPKECLLIPLQRESLYPLRKEFWTKPQLTYNSQLRMKTFSGFYEHPTFYSLLVTPFALDDKTNTWYLHAALPLIDKKETTLIERFMKTSDHVVEPRAKYAALYSTDQKLRFNWATGEIKPFNALTGKLAQTYN